MDTRPCKGCETGAPFDCEYDVQTQCRLCWLFYNNPQYKALWTGQPIPSNEEAQPKIDPECVKRKQLEAQQFRAIATPNGDSLEPIEPRKLREPFLAKRGPSLAQKAVNFTKAVVQHVAAGLPQSSEDLVQQRKTICEGCELYNKSTEECTHRSCGCQMPVKWRWKDQTCPLAKW